MSFDTLNYYLFFPFFFLLYWAFPHKWRLPLMLGASYYFYSCVKPIYLVLIIFSTLVDYFCSNRMEHSLNKKKYLWVSLLTNLSLLSIFKYLDFFIRTLNYLFLSFGINFSIPQQNLDFPIGISFYTLQTLSYTFDVYRGTIKAEKNIFRFSLFVCFFPQLVAGPLERAGKLIPQFKKELKFNYDKAVDGSLLIIWGLLKKTVVSDRLIIIINDIFENPNNSYSGIHFLLTGLMISAKFYCDFSGYSDIAIGSAKILGINLSKNFDFPFLSTNITKFWRRWHTTLSRWFHDYVYLLFPFDKHNRIDPKRLLAILVVFALSGLWHGPAWTFIIWGSINGLYCILLILSQDLRYKLASLLHFHRIPSFIKATLSVLLTNLLVGFSMIFFMSPKLSFSIQFFKNMWSEFAFISLSSMVDAFGFLKFDMTIAFWTLLFIETVNLAKYNNLKIANIREMPLLVRWPLYITSVGFFILFSFKTKSSFSYFYY
ncbi:MAG: MBOAT family protein [Bacteriovoracaceae bacterium]|nr:MBOAT family protein [Bacteriovoracaceae bacterium]